LATLSMAVNKTPATTRARPNSKAPSATYVRGGWRMSCAANTAATVTRKARLPVKCKVAILAPPAPLVVEARSVSSRIGSGNTDPLRSSDIVCNLVVITILLPTVLETRGDSKALRVCCLCSGERWVQNFDWRGNGREARSEGGRR